MTKATRNQSSSAVADPSARTESADQQRQHVNGIDRAVTDDQIAQRAYELYLDRGGEHGADLDDWLQAEAECRRSTSASGPREE